MSPFPTLNEPTFTEYRNSTGSLRKVIWVSKVSHIRLGAWFWGNTHQSDAMRLSGSGLSSSPPIHWSLLYAHTSPEAWLSGSGLGSSPPVHWSPLCMDFTFSLQDFDFILSHLLTWTPMLLNFGLSFWSNNLKLQSSCQVSLCGFDLITQNFNILHVTSF